MQPSQNNPINHSAPVLPQVNLIPQPPAQQQIVQPRQEAAVYFKELKNKLFKIMFISLILSTLVFLVVISASGYYEDEVSINTVKVGQAA